MEGFTVGKAFYSKKIAMEPNKVDSASIIPVDYQDEQWPPAFRQFQPVVFTEGDAVCCLYGPDPQAGIFGCGASVTLAIHDWNQQLQDELNYPTAGNPTVQYIRSTILIP